MPKLEAWQHAVAFTTTPTNLKDHVVDSKTLLRLMQEVAGELQGEVAVAGVEFDATVVWAFQQHGWTFIPLDNNDQPCTYNNPLSDDIKWWCYPHDTGHVPKETAVALCEKCVNAFIK